MASIYIPVGIKPSLRRLTRPFVTCITEQFVPHAPFLNGVGHD